MLLQFLYTGEVGTWFSIYLVWLVKYTHFSDLVSASQLLVEFQELCRILKLNPQVRKTKYAEQQAAAPIITGNSSFHENWISFEKCILRLSETRKHNCNGCSASFDKHSKLIFHLQHCENTEAAPEVNDSQNEKPNNAEVEKLPENVPDEIVSDEIVKNELDPCLGGSGFQMPDNFDLPDEIIQEQLPAARFTSTPIRYANTDIKKSELEVNKRRKEHVSKQQDPRKEVLKSKGFSVAEDLAEKKKRMLLKLRGDEVVEKKGKRPFKDNFVPSRKLVPGAKKARLDKDAVVKKMGKKRRNTESSESSDKEASGDDISEEDETDDETDEEIELKKPPPRVLSSDKKLAVSVQLEGKERIMEFMLYKLKFLTEPITAEDEEDKKTKSIKLAKVGKRIKRIISEDSSEDSSGETVKKLKKEPTIVRTVKKESDEPPPRPISPVKKSEPSTSFIAKLPRM